MRALILVVLLAALLLSPLPASAQTTEVFDAAQLRQVQKIYLEELGDGDSAERFRLLLEEQLLKRGFTIAERPDQADAILIGVLSLALTEGEGDARITVQLKSPNGHRLWSGNFGPRPSDFFHLKDPLKRRAEELSSKLRKDWEQSARKR